MNKIVFTTLILSSFAVSLASQPIELYVATDGNDTNPGTSAKPFATPFRATQAVRQFTSKHLQQDISVFFRQGTYQLDHTWCFSPEDSGTEKFAVTYTACQNEKVTFSGGRRITNWQLANPKQNLWKTHITSSDTENINFRQLFADDKRLTRARFPNIGRFLTVTSVADDLRNFQMDRMIDVSDPAAQKTELVMLQIWSSSRALVDTCSSTALTTATPVGWIGHKSTSAAPDRKCFLENAREFLDKPGEWFFDSKNAELLYIARPGENPNDMNIVAPQIEQLIRIEGTKENPVRNLHFKNIECVHTAWHLPAFGYSGIQAGTYGTIMGKAPTWTIKAAILLDHAEHCSFAAGRIAHTGASGIAIGQGCRHNSILGNEFTDVGGNAIVVGSQHTQDNRRGDRTDPDDAPYADEVSHNFIHHNGTVQFGAVAVQTRFSTDTVIRHNLICYQPYTGISLGFIWNDKPTTQKGNIVSLNIIHHVMQMLEDGGGVYTLGAQPGTRIENNLIHDIDKGQGIYTDQGSSYIVIENNIVYRPYEYAYQHHWGHDNVIRNNIFASTGQYAIERIKARTDMKSGISFSVDRNIFWIDNDTDVFRHGSRKRINDYFYMDYNLYWPTPGHSLTFDKGLSLDQWRQKGHDIHSIVADPLFENVAKDDFRLKPDSPASQIHFHPIDISRAGPQPPYKQKFEPLITEDILSPMIKK